MLRVDFDDDGLALDDLAISGEHIKMLRLEDMGHGSFWGSVALKDGRVLTLTLYAKRKGVLSAGAQWE